MRGVDPQRSLVARLKKVISCQLRGLTPARGAHGNPHRTAGNSLKVITALVVATLALVQSAFSQSKDGAYHCVVEMSAGLAFDGASKKWSAAALRVDQKFVLRMKYGGSHIEEGKQVSDYDITITDAGTDFDRPCSNNQKMITIHDDDGGFRCGTITEDLVVNIKTLRFLRIYPLGYVSGQDNNDNTPSVSGGTCTRID